ncbi:hypothetical protein [Photobacterium galatheae]|uniref:Uncharacterized protein n=1 Tax=Photobacterium galatheae TaxID=1654360 RepID=A0A066RI40_9GAMM|nr:hypothetical protein [Photobacterium galatheae]KDM90105.1 hypothetical protein EA58_19420 [Photobacterium galatheae]MCM0151630.1 hypothetical protein [Photobacterium galatheae]
MPRIKGDKISLLVDGKVIEVKNPSKLNWDLSKSLIKNDNFKEFAKDPKKYAAKFDLEIDADIAAKLTRRLEGFESLKEAEELFGFDPRVAATAWAVAAGAYSIASSKIAVAF